MKPDLKLAVHHVGGRGGTRRFPVLKEFEVDLVNVMYEADASCIEEIRATASQYSSNQHILPLCVSGRPGLTSFHKLYNSTASSVLKIDPKFKRNLPWLAESVVDYDTSAWSTIESSRITGSTLDEILNTGTSPAPMPDFLSINTQGNEAQILSGASTVLGEYCIALQCEVSFRSIYVNQASFDDVTAQARRLGFAFARFVHHELRGHGFTVRDDIIRTPIGLRGGGIQLQSDAIYFKAPDAILSHHRHPMVDLLKAVFIGFILEHFDYSFACAATYIKRAASSELLESEKSRYLYLAFVAAYIEEMARYPRIYPVSWSHVFLPGTDQPRQHAAVRERYFAAVDKASFKKNIPILLDPEFILIEKLAIQFGLSHHAELLRYARLSRIWDTLRRLGLAIERADGGANLNLEPLDAM